jgi:hypothetical protein
VSAPHTDTVPWVGTSSAERRWRRVDFPLPLGPSIPTTSPQDTDNDTSSSAVVVGRPLSSRKRSNSRVPPVPRYVRVTCSHRMTDSDLVSCDIVTERPDTAPVEGVSPRDVWDA